MQLIGIKIGVPTVEALITAVNDPAYSACALALHTLGEIHDPRAAPVLVEAIKNPSADIRQAAVTALAAVKDSRAVAPLLAALKESRWAS